MLKESIKIDAPAEKLYKWFKDLPDNYTSWHSNHITARWIRGNNFKPGSVLYMEEYMGNHIEKLKFKTAQAIPHKLIRFKAMFPENLILSEGSFQFQEQNASTIFTATLSFRFEALLALLFKKKVKLIRQHMKEEGINLKAIMERM